MRGVTVGAGRGSSRQAGDRRHGPSGPSRTPVVPGRAVAGRAGTGDRPVGGRRRASAVPARSAGVLPDRFLRSCRGRHGFVSRSARAATASPPAAQAGNPTVRGTPAHPVRRQPGHGGRDPRHRPGRTAQQITTNLVSARITTGDVARLAAPARKPAERAKEKEGRKEGRKEGIPHVQPSRLPGCRHAAAPGRAGPAATPPPTPCASQQPPHELTTRDEGSLRMPNSTCRDESARGGRQGSAPEVTPRCDDLSPCWKRASYHSQSVAGLLCNCSTRRSAP